jgi:hypothetical protein
MLFAVGCSNNGDNPLNTASVDLNKGGDDPAVSPLSITGDGKPWGDHAHPWDFIWENGLDNTHEFKMTGNGYLVGFMYVEFTNGDTATGGTDAVAWNVHGRPAEAHWDSTQSLWVVSLEDVPRGEGYVHWHPLGDEETAQGMESAPGYFLKHTALYDFYFEPQGRMVYEGIDFDFPNNYRSRGLEQRNRGFIYVKRACSIIQASRTPIRGYCPPFFIRP